MLSLKKYVCPPKSCMKNENSILLPPPTPKYFEFWKTLGSQVSQRGVFPNSVIQRCSTTIGPWHRGTTMSGNCLLRSKQNLWENDRFKKSLPQILTWETLRTLRNTISFVRKSSCLLPMLTYSDKKTPMQRLGSNRCGTQDWTYDTTMEFLKKQRNVDTTINSEVSEL